MHVLLTAMAVLLGAALLVVLLLAIGLAVPLELEVQVDGGQRPAWRVRLLWAWGRIRPLLYPRPAPRSRHPKGGSSRGRRASRSVETADTTTPASRPGHRWSLPRDPAFWREGRRLLGRLRQALRMTGRGHLFFGFEEPDLTGMTCAALPLLPLPPELRLDPDFSDPGLRGEARVRLRVVPLRILVTLIFFVLRRPVRQYLWTQWRRSRQARRQSPASFRLRPGRGRRSPAT